MNYRIVVFGTKDTTRHIMEYIHKELLRVDLVVTVGPDAKSGVPISGYADLELSARQLGIECRRVHSYSLKDPEDLEFFKHHEFELGICVGWQRLIPPEVLDSFKSGVFGFHGSASYLPLGRGRSPLNWSLLEGKKRFINHLFKYDRTADSGQIHSLEIFEINVHDDIRSLGYKVLFVGKRQIKRLVDEYQAGQIKLIPQKAAPTSWYGKRTPEDGKICLDMTTDQIYNLVRSVTRPFPGAFVFHSNEKILIWKAYPFDYFIDTYEYSIGEVIDVFEGAFVLKTLDGTLLISDYEYNGVIKKGDLLQ